MEVAGDDPPPLRERIVRPVIRSMLLPAVSARSRRCEDPLELFRRGDLPRKLDRAVDGQCRRRHHPERHDLHDPGFSFGVGGSPVVLGGGVFVLFRSIGSCGSAGGFR